MLVTLVPVDRPGAKGEAWRVISKRSKVAFSEARGPWLLVVPAGRPPEDMAARGVHGLMDRRFKVMPGSPDWKGKTIMKNLDHATTWNSMPWQEKDVFLQNAFESLSRNPSC